MALTESQKLALQRITKMYPSANKTIIKDAMNQGMSVTKIKQMLGKPTDDPKVKAAMDRFKAAMAKPGQADKPTRKIKTTSSAGMSMPSETTTPKPTANQKQKQRPRGMDPLGLTSKRPPTGTYDRSAVDTGKPKAKLKAKNFNVGVSKGGVPFKEAFKHFRKMGRKTFTWNGKKYTTKLKSEK